MFLCAPSFKTVCLGTVTFSFKKIHLLKMRRDFLPGKLTEKEKYGDGEYSFHLLLNDHSVMLLLKFPS